MVNPTKKKRVKGNSPPKSFILEEKNPKNVSLIKKDEESSSDSPKNLKKPDPDWTKDFPPQNVSKKVESFEKTLGEPSKTEEEHLENKVEATKLSKVKPKKTRPKKTSGSNTSKLEKSIIGLSTNMNKRFDEMKGETANKVSTIENKIEEISNTIKTNDENTKKKLEEQDNKLENILSKERNENNKKFEDLNNAIIEMKEVLKENQQKNIQKAQMSLQFPPLPTGIPTVQQPGAPAVQPTGTSGSPAVQPTGTNLAQVTMRNIPKKPDAPRKPPNDDSRPRIHKNRFANKLHERQVGFKHALEWVEIFMTKLEILAWIGDPAKNLWHDRKILRDPALDNNRLNAFVDKIETNTSLNMHDIEIHQYFLTTNNGIIAWLHLDEPTVTAILRQTSRLPANVFKAVPFIPELARKRKKAVDAILLHYKRNFDENLRYIVKNDEDDIKVMLKRFSEFDHLPYRQIDLNVFGKLPDFDTVTKDNETNEDMARNLDGFEVTRQERKRKKRSSPKKVSQETINQRITRFLDGFDVDVDESSDSDEESEQEEVHVPLQSTSGNVQAAQ